MICKWLGMKALGLTRGWWTLIGLALLALVIMWGIGALTSGATARTEARLNRNMADAAIASGQDAVATIGAQATAESRVDAQTKENENAIRNAEGADAPVSPAVGTALRASLCKRTAYRFDPECLQFTPAR